MKPTATTPRVAAAARELHAALEEAYGCDFAYHVFGLGNVLAASNLIEGFVEPVAVVPDNDNARLWDWVSCENAEDPHVKVVLVSDPAETVAVIPIRNGNVGEAEEEAMEFVSRHNAQIIGSGRVEVIHESPPCQMLASPTGRNTDRQPEFQQLFEPKDRSAAILVSDLAEIEKRVLAAMGLRGDCRYTAGLHTASPPNTMGVNAATWELVEAGRDALHLMLAPDEYTMEKAEAVRNRLSKALPVSANDLERLREVRPIDPIPDQGQVFDDMVEALERIRHARDHHAEHGHYPVEYGINPRSEAMFDDWAADIADTILKRIGR